VVHNGIIENYSQLKQELINKGHAFTSETDTEVISHLIEEHLKNNDFLKSVFLTIKQLKGSFTFLAMHENKIIGVRKDSPLILGVGENEFFLASDVLAFLKYTRKAVVLKNHELVLIENNNFTVYNGLTHEVVEPVVEEIKWDAEEAKKQGFKHFMIKEINEQRSTIKRAIEQDMSEIKKIAEFINLANGVFIIGCGTSYHAALNASYIFSKITGKHVNVTLASEFPHYEHFLKKSTLVIAISQSGETADVLEAVRTAKKKGSKVISLVNVMGSTLMRLSDYSFLINAGPEICVLATKSYTSQLALLLLIAYACANKLEEGKKELIKVGDRVGDIIDNSEYIENLAQLLKNKKDLFLIGRGLSYPTALEAALKLKEVSYVHAEGLAGGELKHGTLALIEQGTPVIVFAPEDETENDIISNALEIKTRGGFIIGISPKKHECFDFHIPVPNGKVYHPILMMIPMQLLAYQLALLRGCDPDFPRNLAKSVTVK